MNNNYHTQLEKQNNMLNEIAANNQLLQPQMQNFQGTPINRNPVQNPNQLPNMSYNPMQPPMQPSIQQPMYPQPTQQPVQQPIQHPQQPQQIQSMQPQQINSQMNYATQNPYHERPTNDGYNLPQHATQLNDLGEIDLSEAKPEPDHQIRKAISPQVDTRKKQYIPRNQTNSQYPLPDQQNHPQQIQQANQTYIPQQQIEIPTNENNMPTPIINQGVSKQLQTQNDNSRQMIATAPKRQVAQLPPRYPPVANPPKADNKLAQYVIVPAALAIIFIILVHPVTSKILDKYLPPMKNMKGYLVRAVILALAYVVINFAANKFAK